MGLPIAGVVILAAGAGFIIMNQHPAPPEHVQSSSEALASAAVAKIADEAASKVYGTPEPEPTKSYPASPRITSTIPEPGDPVDTSEANKLANFASSSANPLTKVAATAKQKAQKAQKAQSTSATKQNHTSATPKAQKTATGPTTTTVPATATTSPSSTSTSTPLPPTMPKTATAPNFITHFKAPYG